MLTSILSLERGVHSTRILAALFAYYFERINQKQFIEYVGDAEEGRRIKDIARKNGYILMNCKLYAYAVHAARRDLKPLPRYADYDVAKEDAPLLRRLNLKHLDKPARRSSDFAAVRKTKDWSPPRAFGLKEYQDQVAQCLQSKELRDYIGKFIHKKMAFLIQSYGDNYKDIFAFLQEQALLAVYIKYPYYENLLHMTNIAKATIHNKGQSYISSCTSKSRQRLCRNEDGHFESVHVDMSTMAELEAPPNFGLALREGLTALAAIQHKIPARTQEFLLALGGHHHPGFSAMLGIDNSDAVEHMDYDNYMEHLRTYFQTTEERVDKIFMGLRNIIYRCNHDTTTFDRAA